MSTNKEFANKVVLLRGEIISQVIVLERYIDIYLAYYFTHTDGAKFTEMLELILSSDKMSFDGKRQVFCFLLKKHEPTFIAKYSSISNDLIYILQQRNILAHYIFDLSDEAVRERPEIISFIKYKNATSLVDFDENKINNLVN